MWMIHVVFAVVNVVLLNCTVVTEFIREQDHLIYRSLLWVNRAMHWQSNYREDSGCQCQSFPAIVRPTALHYASHIKAH